jgi:DnaK suppressor protein
MSTAASSNARELALDPQQRQRRQALRRMLRNVRAQVKTHLRSLRAALPSDPAASLEAQEDAVEVSRNIEATLAEMRSQTLQRIDEALARLERGTYGTCTRCGDPIAEARLAAMPFAELCRGCQEEAESELFRSAPLRSQHSQSAGPARGGESAVGVQAEPGDGSGGD